MMISRLWIAVIAITIAIPANILMIMLCAWSSAGVVPAYVPTTTPLIAITKQSADPPPQLARPLARVVTAVEPSPARPVLSDLPSLPVLTPPLAPPLGKNWLEHVSLPITSSPNSGSVPDPTPGDGLDEIPRPLAVMDLQRFYPRRAFREREEATVRMQLTIDEQGNVLQVQILANDGIPEFADASIRAVRSLRWTPPRRDNHPVTGRFITAIKWQMPP